MRFDVRRTLSVAALVGLVAATPGSAGAQDAGSAAPFNVPAFDKVTFSDQGAEVERLTDGIHMTEDETTPTRASGPMSMAPHPDNPRSSPPPRRTCEPACATCWCPPTPG